MSKPLTARPALPSSSGGRALRRERGLASLIVVSLLFFIISLVAAYTNRNLIFEQRTSGNQYRSTQAFEAAEAGVEWALAMLNNGRATLACNATDDATFTSFRQRYLGIDAETGMVQPLPNQATQPQAPPLPAIAASWPSCTFDGTNWVCSCPAQGSATLAAAAATGTSPSFRLRFVQRPAARPGTVWLEVNGCTRPDNDCLNFPATGLQGEGRARLEVLLALKSALPSTPTAAVTVRGNFNVNGTAFGAFNPSTASSGWALLTGGALSNDLGLQFGGAAGEPASRASLVGTAPAVAAVPTGPRFFSATFGAEAPTYLDQPATLRLDCTVLTCDATLLRQVHARNPGRIIWAQGPVALSGGADLGTANDPVLLVVEGDLSLNNINVNGLVYGRNQDWNLTGAGAFIRGALVAENNLQGGSTINVVHDGQALSVLRWQYGSFVRVPGAWRDY
jgi:PilX N-terminal